MFEKFRPDYLILGHVTKDNIPGGAILGGTCSYAALTAYRLGQKVGLVTSVGPDIPSLSVLEGVCVKSLPADQSTTFENIYENGTRRQKWLSSSEEVLFPNVPSEWRQAPIVHLGPIGQEVSPALSSRFPNSLIGATAQGWLRGRDDDNNVIYQPHPELEASLPHIDVMVVSISDLFGDKAALVHLLTSVKMGVETLGPEGCRIFYRGDIIHVPVDPQDEVDPTGAGDIFAATFFVKYHQTGDFIQAARFANTCASLSVGKIGLAGVPDRSNVEDRVSRIYPCCDAV